MGPGVGAACLALLVLAQAAGAWASTFTVNPVQLVLSGRARSALLTLKNTSAEPLRFQLGVVAWDQSPQGELVLTPTRDIAFFPRLLSLAPGEERRVRVGALVPPGTTEKTYRLFVEELPPRETPGGEPGAQVRVLTRMGIPIFLQPANPVVEGRIEAAEVRNGRLSFRVANRGTVHFLVQEVRLTGLGAGGEPVLTAELGGWYVLAGGIRLYGVELPREACPRLRALDLAVQVVGTAFQARLDVPAGACDR